MTLYILSILDHSCQPNCVVSFSGPAVTVTTFTGVKTLEEARISYLDPKLPTKTRQGESEEGRNHFWH